MLLYPTFQINPPLYYMRLLIVPSTAGRLHPPRLILRLDSLCRYLIGHNTLPESKGIKGLLTPASPVPGTDNVFSKWALMYLVSCVGNTPAEHTQVWKPLIFLKMRPFFCAVSVHLTGWSWDVRMSYDTMVTHYERIYSKANLNFFFKGFILIFTCIHVCVPCACLVPREARDYWILWNWSEMVGVAV